MKWILTTIMIGLLTSINVYSQARDSVLIKPHSVFFTPSYLIVNNTVNNELENFPKSFSLLPKNKFLNNATVLILENLKYNSVIDKFSSNIPFDVRAYKATTVSEYNRFIEKNYFLLQVPNIQR